MKIFSAILLLVTSCLLACADEQSAPPKNPAPDSTEDYAGKVGIGVIVGEPTGISAKYWLNDNFALDTAAGWSLRRDSDFYLHGDVLWHDFDLIPISNGQLPVYIGAGGLARFRDSGHANEVGLRMPVGASYMLENTPMDIFVEIAPGIDVSPDIRADITGGIGIRYWF